ncbi:hypothetical protein FHQ18_11425 [Deferribacter autotrophicus]|uniref:Exonuclease domain-containing protein n=1 Tax=Deferribacter autotrophicus TaxID=500465 RepID=A0A5A8EZR4_9BACT|nr:exonuclease domain-containing protein [Deferribacter autotrophicus]KAA0257170.1 hypothetical protein FHQ18_11425 [Deferribacter autotrophicus]
MNYSSEVKEILDTPLNMLTFVVFDIETTGIHPENGDKILEIGAVKLHPDFRFYFISCG